MLREFGSILRSPLNQRRGFEVGVYYEVRREKGTGQGDRSRNVTET